MHCTSGCKCFQVPEREGSPTQCDRSSLVLSQEDDGGEEEQHVEEVRVARQLREQVDGGGLPLEREGHSDEQRGLTGAAHVRRALRYRCTILYCKMLSVALYSSVVSEYCRTTGRDETMRRSGEWAALVRSVRSGRDTSRSRSERHSRREENTRASCRVASDRIGSRVRVKGEQMRGA